MTLVNFCMYKCMQPHDLVRGKCAKLWLFLSQSEIGLVQTLLVRCGSKLCSSYARIEQISKTGITSCDLTVQQADQERERFDARTIFILEPCTPHRCILGPPRHIPLPSVFYD